MNLGSVMHATFQRTPKPRLMHTAFHHVHVLALSRDLFALPRAWYGELVRTLHTEVVLEQPKTRMQAASGPLTIGAMAATSTGDCPS